MNLFPLLRCFFPILGCIFPILRCTFTSAQFNLFWRLFIFLGFFFPFSGDHFFFSWWLFSIFLVIALFYFWKSLSIFLVTIFIFLCDFFLFFGDFLSLILEIFPFMRKSFYFSWWPILIFGDHSFKKNTKNNYSKWSATLRSGLILCCFALPRVCGGIYFTNGNPIVNSYLRTKFIEKVVKIDLLPLNWCGSDVFDYEKIAWIAPNWSSLIRRLFRRKSNWSIFIRLKLFQHSNKLLIIFSFQYLINRSIIIEIKVVICTTEKRMLELKKTMDFVSSEQRTCNETRWPTNYKRKRNW